MSNNRTNNPTPCTALMTIEKKPRLDLYPNRETAIYWDALATAQRMTAEGKAAHWPTAPDLYTFAEAYTVQVGDTARYLALRAKHASSGLYLMQTLIQAAGRDAEARAVADYAVQADSLKAKAAKHRKEAASLRNKAKAIKRTDAERAALLKMAEEHTAQANRYSGERQDLEKRMYNTTVSVAEDAAQEARAAYWATVDFNAACAAAGQSVRDLQAAQGCTNSRTKVLPVKSEAELNRLRERVKEYQCKGQEESDVEVPFRVRGLGQTVGCWTLEYRNTERHPAGYYKVMHYITLGRLSLDSFATDVSDTDPSEESRAVYRAIKAADVAEHEADYTPIIDRAKLNKRQRLYVRKTIDPHDALTVAAGVKAVHKHMQTTDAQAKAAPNPKTAKTIRRRAAGKTEVKRVKAQLNAAMLQVGVPLSQLANQRTELKRKLSEAMTKDAPKAAEQAAQIAPKAYTMPWYMEGVEMPTKEHKAVKITIRNDYKRRQQPTIRIVWRETYNAAEAVTIPQDMTIHTDHTPHTMTEEEQKRLEECRSRRAAEAVQNLAYWTEQAPKDARRAARLETLAQAAEQDAHKAAEAAQKYSKQDTTEAARQARKTAAEAHKAAQTARAKATDAKRDVEQAEQNAAFYASIITV